MAKTVTLHELARRAELSVAAVSYALRGSPKVSRATAERVRRLATECGYRPNPRVAELMTHIRSGRRRIRGETLALVWLDGDPRAEGPFRAEVHAGARARAAEWGFALEAFWRTGRAGEEVRLARILRSRGIAGVVFGSAESLRPIRLDWPWEDFAMAVVGVAEWSVPISRAGHHHYEAMWTAGERLRERGVRRPAAWIDPLVNARARHTWEAAWLASAGPGAAQRLTIERGPGRAKAADWARRLRPDGVVLSDRRSLDVFRAALPALPAERFVLLDWRPGDAAAGIEQAYDLVAANAVDLVVAQLQRNERGLPDPARTLYFPGRWREPERADQ